MKVLTAHAREDAQQDFESSDGQGYVWRRDFPVSLQSRARATESIFRLEFSLDENEVAEFSEKIKNNLDGKLPIEVKFGKSNIPDIHVPKRGPGGNALSEKPARLLNTSQLTFSSTTFLQLELKMKHFLLFRPVFLFEARNVKGDTDQSPETNVPTKSSPTYRATPVSTTLHDCRVRQYRAVYAACHRFRLAG